jgi:hypothetical protein
MITGTDSSIVRILFKFAKMIVNAEKERHEIKIVEPGETYLVEKWWMF